PSSAIGAQVCPDWTCVGGLKTAAAAKSPAAGAWMPAQVSPCLLVAERGAASARFTGVATRRRRARGPRGQGRMRARGPGASAARVFDAWSNSALAAFRSLRDPMAETIVVSFAMVRASLFEHL